MMLSRLEAENDSYRTAWYCTCAAIGPQLPHLLNILLYSTVVSWLQCLKFRSCDAGGSSGLILSYVDYYIYLHTEWLC